MSLEHTASIQIFAHWTLLPYGYPRGYTIGVS